MSQHLTGYVYFVYARQVERVKIGYSRNHPDGRLTQMQSGSPVPLERLAFVRGVPPLAEFLWHGRFKSLRVLGEWFEATPELLEVLSREAEPWTPLEGRPRKTPEVRPRNLEVRPRKPTESCPRVRTKLPSGAKILGGPGPGKKSGIWRRISSDGAWYTTLWGQQIWLAPPEASQRKAERALLTYARETGCVSKIII